MIRVFLACLGLMSLVACSGFESGPIDPVIRQQAAVVGSDAPSLTLLTMQRKSGDTGTHAALMISGSQRVIFDPAGSYFGDHVVRYGDVIYGASDPLYRSFMASYAKGSHRIVIQTIPVSPAVAEQALAIVEAGGTVAPAHCTQAISSILRQLPGLSEINPTYFPNTLLEQVDTIPGVRRSVFENTPS